MPRQAHGGGLNRSAPSRNAKRNRTERRGLDALEIAERENVDQYKVPQHRLGEIEPDPTDRSTGFDPNERSTKRRKFDNAQDEDIDDEGSDSEGNHWHVGVGKDDEDSDIDSDEAFGESDEERFSGFKFGGSGNKKSSKPVKAGLKSQADQRAIDLSEGDSDLDDVESLRSSSDSFGEDAVDLATAWDLENAENQGQSTSKSLRKKAGFSSNGSNSSASTQSDYSDYSSEEKQDDEFSAFSVSDEEDGDHTRLQSFVEELEASSKKGNQPTERRNLKSSSKEPSQFGIVSKLSAADLLQYVKDPDQRRSLKILQDNQRKENEPYKGGIPGKLAPPLAKRQQDRLDRQAAYGEAKTQLGRWIETVKSNRRAEHISFPLNEPGENLTLGAKQLTTSSSSRPFNPLETKIQEIMQENGMLSGNGRAIGLEEQEFEELKNNKIPLAELQARRAELRRERDLLFREEIRARRINKIKSKAYRRIHRKERAKSKLEIKEQLAAQGLQDSDEERERHDRQRAEARVGARHRESKWAKEVKASGRTVWDDDAKVGVVDLAQRDEELRRRIEGKSIGDGQDSVNESNSDMDEDSDSETESKRLQQRINIVETPETDFTRSRLASMPFMRKAETARKIVNDEELKAIKKSLRNGHNDDDHASEEDSAPEPGRRKFGKGPQQVSQTPPIISNKSEFEERMSDDDDNDDNFDAQRGGLSPARDSKDRKTEKRIASQKVSSQKSPRDESKKKVQSKSGSTTSTTASTINSNSKTNNAQVEDNIIDDYESTSDSDIETSEPEAQTQNNVTLADTIFAGPEDVLEEFVKEKRQTIEEEGDQVTDNTLPGWGSWAGEGISKREQKRSQGRFLTTVKGISADQRKDAKLDRVIINEKRVKKSNKYLATELPHPFELRHQYERSLRLPLGPEWTTKTTFQDATKPRVLVRQGIIRPMSKPLA